MHSLSFDYIFDEKDEFVYFAYCVPYSYSLLKFKLKELECKHPSIVCIDRTNKSSGGLTVPILTITNQNSKEQNESK